MKLAIQGEFIETDISRILGWSYAYWLIIGLILAVCTFCVPDFKTRSISVANAWRRGDTYYTDWLPLSNLVAYTLCNCVGFLYVNHVSLNRQEFFVSGRDKNIDLFLTVFIISPMMFFVSVLPTWCSTHSKDLIEFPKSLETTQDKTSSSESSLRVWLYNWLIWGTFFILGL